jgi:hypothetical protein
MVGYSLLIVGITAQTAAILILWSGLKSFVRSKSELENWDHAGGVVNLTKVAS